MQSQSILEGEFASSSFWSRDFWCHNSDKKSSLWNSRPTVTSTRLDHQLRWSDLIGSYWGSYIGYSLYRVLQPLLGVTPPPQPNEVAGWLYGDTELRLP